MYTDNYVVKSLELHLFFGRIMKEHSLFLKAGFTPVDASFSSRAEHYQKEFENLLNCAVMISDGVVSEEVLNSGEIVTEFTALAERQTQKFTGIPINSRITEMEMQLSKNRCMGCINPDLRGKVRRLNKRALELLDGLISFKEQILRNVLDCKMFTMNYPLLIEHIIREAKLYREYVEALETDGCLCEETMKDVECFWNRIMMEHAMFIRGLLDPAEAELINTADEFANEYSELLENCRSAHTRTIERSSFDETVRFRDFKTTGVKGITHCDIRSAILPLLADHVLREANHYLRLLK